MKTKKLTKKEILHLAKLAGLMLNDNEINKYSSQLAETIDYIRNLDELNTTDVEPTNSIVDLKNVTFDDGAANTAGLTEKEVFENTDKSVNNAFVVERIL